MPRQLAATRVLSRPLLTSADSVCSSQTVIFTFVPAYPERLMRGIGVLIAVRR
jgi:hypothetical protein